MLWNVEGLKYVLKHMEQEYLNSFHGLLLTETFQTSATSITGFYCYEELARKENAGRPVGGILIAVKPNLTNSKLLGHTEHVVAVSTGMISMACFYFNPKCDTVIMLEEVAERLCNMDLSKPCIIAGDFNARVDIDDNEKAELLIDLLADFGFLLVNDPAEHTYTCHNGGSTIDLVFANFPDCRAETEKLNPSLLLRKHYPIVITWTGTPVPSRAEKQPRKKRVIGDIDPMAAAEIERRLSEGELDAAYEKMCQTILEAVPDAVVTEGPRHHRRCVEIEKLKLELLHLRRRVQTSPFMRRRYHERRLEYKRRIQEEKNRRKEVEEERRIREAQDRPWKLNPRRNGSSVTSRIPLEEWSPHFSQVYNPDPEPNLPPSIREHDYACNASEVIDDTWFLETDMDDERTRQLNKDVTEFEALTTLNTCSDKKAVGPDRIASEHIKGSFTALGHLWVMMFNLILTTGITVEAWRKSTVMVLYKGKGDLRDPNMYRGIALLSHAFKWFTKMVARRLVEYVDGRTLPEEQFGFRKGRSTMDAFGRLRNFVKERLQKPKTPVFAVFVDFSKAFDMVPRRALIRKMALLHHIRGALLRVIFVILQFNLIKVYDNVDYSEDIRQTRGVQQGDSLSPLLFLLFVADLPGALKDVGRTLEAVMFADDLVFYSTSPEDIQSALNALSLYCKINRMRVNLSKTKVMVFRRGGRTGKHVFTFEGSVVEQCNAYEYLGITVQPKWTFTKHLIKQRTKATVACFKFRDLQQLSLRGADKFFRTMIEPILTYGISTLWSDLSARQLEILDGAWFGFYKRVLGLHQSTRNRLIILLVEAPTLVESLVRRGVVPSTPAYEEYRRALEEKVSDVDEGFLRSPAMHQTTWRGPQQAKRHLVTRGSVHGFHHKLCSKSSVVKACWRMDRDCICKYCQSSCASLTHVFDCKYFLDKSLAVIDEL
jgi:hypothetical protein